MDKSHANEIRILAGQWRPHHPFEQIAWVSPPWPSHDYIWLDFPEAIFADLGLLYLSHVNPRFPVLFPDLPKVPWANVAGGIRFERRLPNGVTFGGSVLKGEGPAVSLELSIRNESQRPLRDIKLQTCAYLRAIREFADFTQTNKFVHVPGGGWITLADALERTDEGGEYRLGWRGGTKASDLPVMATVSNQGERLVAMTWHKNTYSLIGNPRHPCMHADPCFPDLAPNQQRRVRGHLIFFEGSLGSFKTWFRDTRAQGQP